MEYKCPCGKSYSYRQGLHVHRKTCKEHNNVSNAVCIEHNKPSQHVEAQPVEAVKLSVELDEQLKVYKQLLEEKDKLLQEQEKRYKQLLEEKDKLLEEKDKLLEEKDKRIEDQKQTIEFMKTIAMRPAIMQPEVKPAKKHISTKEYLNSRNPITIDEFYDNYKPTIEEYDNIFSMGFVNAIVTNFANYAKSYKDRCPILFANTQYERLHVYVYKKDEPKKDKPKEDEPKDDEPKDNEPKDDEQNDNEQLKEQWFDYERIDAHMYMKDKIIIRYVNKYQHYISVFNDKYKKCLDKPSNHEENNEDIAKKLSLTMAINTAENVSDRICKEIAHKLAINRNE